MCCMSNHHVNVCSTAYFRVHIISNIIYSILNNTCGFNLACALLRTLKLGIFHTCRSCFFVCLLFMSGTHVFPEWNKEVHVKVHLHRPNFQYLFLSILI